MKNSKGISMISLLITIIVTILLASMALGTGTRYLRDSKLKEKENFIEVLSSAVSKRQEDVNVNSLAYPYLGYYINNSLVFESIFAPKVKEEITYENSIWYVVDNAAATHLGIKEIGDYIDSVDAAADDEEIRVALVDYKSGAVHLINVNSYELSGLEVSKNDFVTGHTHRYLDEEPTCTTPVKCEDCGFILKEALGHMYEITPETISYDDRTHFTKQCIRENCGMAGGFALHTLQTTSLIRDDVWYHNISCPVCNYEKIDEPCNIQYYLPSTTEEKEIHHIKYCSVCTQSENEEHTIGYRRISESMHEVYCKVKACNYTIDRENHVDATDDRICDLCNAEIIDYSYPQLTKVEMVNVDAVKEGNRYYAKYGDTIKMEIQADKKIQNLRITIGGATVPSSAMTTLDQESWTIQFYLDQTLRFDEGQMKITIDCESIAGIPMPSTFVTTTDSNPIVFDGVNPIVEYINKIFRVNE